MTDPRRAAGYRPPLRFRLLPGWAQTIRFRLTVTYSLVLFGVCAAVIAAIYLVLSATVEAEPLEPVRVHEPPAELQAPPNPEGLPPAKVWRGLDEWYVDEEASFEAADIEAVEAAVNHELLELLRAFSVTALVALFAASLAVGWWLSGRALRPVRHITATAREISATDLSRRIDLPGPRDELRTLADTLDEMLGRLHEAFTAQRQLVDDASHDLRNPLAVIQANVDAVLAQDDVSPAERARATAVVTRAANRMRHVVEDLLSAARRRSPAFVDAAVDVAEVAGNVADEYAALAEQRELRLTRRFDGHPTVAGDARAIHRAADNLLANAVRLSPDGGEVTVGVGSGDGWAWLAVRDQGPGVAAGEQARIFDRRYTGETASAPGAGLGLAIVRQIAESHDGTVAVHSAPSEAPGEAPGGPPGGAPGEAPGQGSTFVVWLPERATPGPAERSAHPPSTNPLPLPRSRRTKAAAAGA